MRCLFCLSLLVIILVLVAFLSTERHASAQLRPEVLQCTLAPAGLISWWPGDGDAIDIRSFNNGTLQGSATFSVGEVGQAFSFDSTNNTGVLIGNPASLRLQDFTIDAWIKRSRLDVAGGGAAGEGVIVAYGHFGYGLGIAQDGQLFLTKVDFSGTFSGLPVTDTAFHHVAVTKSGSTVVFYLDGVASGPVTDSDVFEFTKDRFQKFACRAFVIGNYYA